jgi:hypothetical protein
MNEDDKYGKIVPTLVFLLLSYLLLDISYRGIVLQSIHRNTWQMSINFDGSSAIIFEVITLISNIYLLYSFLGMFRPRDNLQQK